MDLWQDGVVVREKIEPFLGGVAGDVWEEETGCEEEGLFFGKGLELVDGPGGDLVISFVFVAVGEHSPIHAWVISHRGWSDEFCWWANPDPSGFSGDLELWILGVG